VGARSEPAAAPADAAGAASPKALAAALAARPGFAGIGPEALSLLPAKGLVHDHYRVAGRRVDGKGVILRVPRFSQWGLAPAQNLAYAAAGFERIAAGGHGPRLFDLLAPAPGLPQGALMVEEIRGRPPRLPDDMAAIARALAETHGLALPPPAARPPLESHDDPVAGILARIELQAAFLDELDLAGAARAAIAEELAWARAFAARAPAQGAPPLALVFTDTHPGNFLIEPGGRAVNVDLEKVIYGAAAADLAHASLYTSTMWDPDCAAALSREEVRAFYRAYLEAATATSERLAPWLLPFRRLVWLRTLTFCARWRVESARRAEWSTARLAPAPRAHFEALMEDFFAPERIAAIRAEWLGPDPLGLG